MTALSRPMTRLTLLLFILLLGWALRIHQVDARSLWEDEGWTMLLSKGPGLDDVARTMAADQHPPLFFMVFRLWRDVAGETEFATRLFSILISLIAVAGIYALGRELFGDEVGILAALLLALSDLHIDLAQEVRHYGALTTLIILSSLFYVRWWRNPSRGNRIGYVLTSIALLYTHYLGGYVLIAQLIHMCMAARPKKRLFDGLFLFGAICLGFLPWLPVVIDQNRLRWTNPLYYQNSIPNNMQTYRAVRVALFGSQYGLMAALMLLGLVYLIYHNRQPVVRLRPIWPTLYLGLWIGLMAGLTVYINAHKSFLTVRNFIVIVPAICILIGHGLHNLDRFARLLLTGVIVVVSLTTVDAQRSYPNWRNVTKNITDYHLDNEPILMDIWVGDFPVRYYIDQQMGEDTPRVSLREWRDQYKADFIPHLQGYLANIDAFWLIYWGDKPMDEYGPAIEQAGFQRTATLAVNHMGTPLYCYRYDKLTETEIARFGDLFALRKYYIPAQATPGETIPITLWWTAESVPPLDYSVSVYLVDEAGNKAAQQDGPPLNGQSPTTTWIPGELQYDNHRIDLPLAPGTYRVRLAIYWYGDPDQPLPVGAEQIPYAELGTVKIGK